MGSVPGNFQLLQTCQYITIILIFAEQQFASFVLKVKRCRVVEGKWIVDVCNHIIVPQGKRIRLMATERMAKYVLNDNLF